MNDEVRSDDDSLILRILREIRGFLITLLVLLAIVLVINIFIGRLVKVDGHSMDTTLSNGEILVMDKISYKFSDPKRYDIVIFPHEDKYYIKRVIGLPGETVQIIDGAFYINGEKLDDNHGLEPIEESMYGRAAEPVKLANDEYFCVGDNRNHSGDSRLESVGNVKRDIIDGKAIFRLTPIKRFGTLN